MLQWCGAGRRGSWTTSEGLHCGLRRTTEGGHYQILSGGWTRSDNSCFSYNQWIFSGLPANQNLPEYYNTFSEMTWSCICLEHSSCLINIECMDAFTVPCLVMQSLPLLSRGVTFSRRHEWSLRKKTLWCPHSQLSYNMEHATGMLWKLTDLSWGLSHCVCMLRLQ